MKKAVFQLRIVKNMHKMALVILSLLCTSVSYANSTTYYVDNKKNIDNNVSMDYFRITNCYIHDIGDTTKLP